MDEILQKQVELGSSGLDILHGDLKNRMLEAEQHLQMCIEREENSGEAIDSMDRTYAEGFLDALVSLYGLTYELSFAIQDRDKS
jgi:hypothetical protein